jgi:hypothetical protein
VAALSTHDIAWSVRELERAHANGLIGAVLPVNGFFTSASARSFAPIFEAAQRLGSHIYLHTGYASPNVPGQPPIVEHVDNAAARWVLDNGWHFASAVATLAFGDFLDPYPDVTVQVAMLGDRGWPPWSPNRSKSPARAAASPMCAPVSAASGWTRARRATARRRWRRPSVCWGRTGWCSDRTLRPCPPFRR